MLIRLFKFIKDYALAEWQLRKHNIKSTVIVFGSARQICGQGVHLGELITRCLSRPTNYTEFVVATGGGPGEMAEANFGAKMENGKSIGFNINLPNEQKPNEYISPGLSLNFKYFSMRKFHGLARAKAVVLLPGGYGTLDELFETLTLLQTNKMERIPVILIGEGYWENVINWNILVAEGMIDEGDLDLFTIVEEADDAVNIIKEHYKL